MWQVWRPPEFVALLARRALDPGLVWATVGLAGLLLASAIVVVLVNRWRRQDSCGTAGTLDYQSLFEQGLLSREELERIRGGHQKTKPSEPTATADAAQTGPQENAVKPPLSPHDAPSVADPPQTGHDPR